jgi:MFS family permease
MMLSLLKDIPVRAKNFSKTHPVAARYMLDGLLISSAGNIAANNHNLFAIRLGANDYQLSLVQVMPQIFSLLFLIPGGLLIDRLHNKRRAVILTQVAMMFGYLLCSVSPFASAYSIYFFLVSLSLATCAMELYNISWLSFFPNVVDLTSRNRVLTLRTRVCLYVGMIMPLLVGAILVRVRSTGGKIMTHQGFYLSAIFLLLLAALNFRKFHTAQPSGPGHITPGHIALPNIIKAGKSIARNKLFLFFTGAVLFFHATWHFDWTLYFIGKVNYLRMNEFQLGLVELVSAAVQLLTLKFWSRINERRGVVLPFTLGILGLSLCPVFMLTSVSLPASVGPHLFMLLHTLAYIPFCVVTLNLNQCLLLVVGEEYKSFSISFFTCLICLSHAVMPMVGVALYHAMGGDINGFRYSLGIIAALRIVAAGLWLLYWRFQSKSNTGV